MTLILSQLAFSQVILNGSFENTTASMACNYNLNNGAFNALMPNVNAYGGGNEMDILIAGCYAPTIPDGVRAVGLAHVPQDEIAMTISPPLISGQTYTLKFWTRSDPLRPQGNILVGVSTSSSSFGTQVYNATTVVSTWTYHTVTFSAPNNGAYLTVKNAPGAIYWNHVDGFEFEVGIYGDTSVCEDSTAMIYSNRAETVYWVDSANQGVVLSTQDTIYVSPTVSTTYLCIGDTTGDTLSWHVSVITFPSGFAGNDTTVCDGDTVNRLAYYPGNTYLWSNGDTDSLFTTLDSGAHWLTLQRAGCSASDTFNVEFLPFPVVELGNDTLICDYSSFLVTSGANSGYTHLWSNGSNQPQILINDSGTFSVHVSNAQCSKSDTIHVGYFPHVQVDLGNNEVLCYLSDTSITPVSQSNVATYSWSNGQTGNVATAFISGTYTLTVMGNGCEFVDQVDLLFHYDPQVNLGADTSYCATDALTLETGLNPVGHVFLWNDGSNSHRKNVVAPSIGVFWVEVSDGICKMRDSIVVGLYPSLGLTLGKDQIACKGDSLHIQSNVDPAWDYLWNTGDTGEAIVVYESGVYRMTVTDGLCYEYDDVFVNFLDKPMINVGNDTVVCAPAEVNLKARSNLHNPKIHWSNGSNAEQIYVYIDGSKSFSASVSNGYCTSRDTITVKLAAPPKAEIPEDTALCEGKMIIVEAKGPEDASYTWSNGITGKELKASEPGTYTLVVSDSNCASTNSIDIREIPNPIIDLGGTKLLCVGEELILDATADGIERYEWNDGTVYSTLSVNADGEYYVKGWHLCGVATDTVAVLSCDCYVRFPSAFRPESAGPNTHFGPVTECEIISYQLRIFDRWGELIFETQSSDRLWDGRFNNTMVPIGTYVWIVEYDAMQNGEIVKMKDQGTVAVLK
ncbi:MAG: gliding motility-associated C-terminal domain-containing protein [Flavobacteriales bacterium]